MIFPTVGASGVEDQFKASHVGDIIEEINKRSAGRLGHSYEEQYRHRGVGAGGLDRFGGAGRRKGGRGNGGWMSVTNSYRIEFIDLREGGKEQKGRKEQYIYIVREEEGEERKNQKH